MPSIQISKQAKLSNIDQEHAYVGRKNKFFGKIKDNGY